MDEQFLSEEELAGVSGGLGGSDFSRIAVEFAWKNKCTNCPHKNIFRSHAMCLEVYCELLTNFSMNKPIDWRCFRREEGGAGIWIPARRGGRALRRSARGPGGSGSRPQRSQRPEYLRSSY